MNIFVLDKDPKLAARAMMDCHIARQLLACEQLMCYAHIHCDGPRIATTRIPHLVKLREHEAKLGWAHWACGSSGNYGWLLQLLTELAEEYRLRFRLPAPAPDLRLELLRRPMMIPIGERTRWPQVMPPQYRNSSTVEAYRNYYVFVKQKELDTEIRWSHPATIPTWWVKLENVHG